VGPLLFSDPVFPAPGGGSRKRSGPPVFRRGFFLVFILPLFVSCASVPGARDREPENDFAFLPPGASLYLYADTAGARPILDLLSFGEMSGGAFPAILDRTHSAVAAFYSEGAGRRFFAVGRGDYPRLRSGFSLAFSPAWKKRRSESGGTYWYSAGYKLAVSIGAGRAFLSDGDPLGIFPETQTPENFESLSRGSVLAGWLSGGAAPINAFFAARDIPLQIPAEQVLFAVHPLQGDGGTEGGEGGTYEIAIRLETPTVSQAQGLVSIISMMRLFMTGAFEPEDPLGIVMGLFLRQPVRDGPNLILHSGPLDARGIALLFNIFSLYSSYY
jgi:hypothetical protein